MKKAMGLFLMIAVLFVLSGCSSVKFSNPTDYQSVNQSAKVSLSIQDQSLTETGLVLLIANHSGEELSYDMTYAVEQKRDNVWYSMDGDHYFNSLAALLDPYATNEFSVTWEKALPKGTYRVVKPVNTGDGDGLFAVEFEVS